MVIFPAIDIRGGKCVRLFKGDFAQETVFSDKPEDMAVKWQQQGGKFLHLVDLDGALAGKSQNLEVVKRIIASVDIPVELGGGIRTMENIDEVLALGVRRVILGSVAVQNPELVKEACDKYGDRIVVGIDAKDGIVAVDGWGVSGNVEVVELAKKMAAAGVKTIIYTDISRDGTLSGVNVEATAKLARESGVKVVASGGVKSLEDIKALLNGQPVSYGTSIEDAVNFIDYEMNLLTKKNSSESKKPTKTQQENEGYKALILEFLATLPDDKDGATCTEIIKGVAAFEVFSTQKISPLVRQLMAADKVTKTEVKGKSLFRLA